MITVFIFQPEGLVILPSLVCSAWSLRVNGEMKTLHIWSDCRAGSLKVNTSPPNTLQFLSAMTKDPAPGPGCWAGGQVSLEAI